MIKAGLILGAVMLVLGVGGQSAACAALCAVSGGDGGHRHGYVAGVFDKPLTSGDSAKVGAIAGAIGGAGALLGQIIGGILNAIMVDPQKMMQMMEQFGLPTTYDANFDHDQPNWRRRVLRPDRHCPHGRAWRAGRHSLAADCR